MRCFLTLSIVFLTAQLYFQNGLCLKKKVIVIGSGVAGLSAASSLIQKGVKDIAVLEARNRVGGRTNTIPFENGFIEMGAQWIHGSTNNPVYTLCKSLNLVDEATKTEFGDMYYATQDATQILESYVDKIQLKIEDLFYAAEIEADTLTPSTDKSLKSILDRKFDELLAKMQLSSSESQLVRAIYDDRLKEEKFDTACSDLNQLSAIGWNSYSESGGDDLINLKSGYISLINHFKNQVTNQNIFLNEVVTQIEYPSTPASSTNTVKIYTTNAITGSKSIHEADYVLTTFPLGYLKANYKTLFNPPLPTSKVNAIEKLGFGVVNKYWLVFDSPPLATYGQGVRLLWRNDLSFQVDSLMSKCGLGNFPFYKAIGSFEALPTMKNVLYAFMAGEDAMFTEYLNDNCLLEVFYEMISKAFPKLRIPKPKSILRSKWHGDEYTKGSYSFIKMGSSTTDVKNLAESVYSRVFFAGEATSHKYISAVHGAYESGLREADKISKLII